MSDENMRFMYSQLCSSYLAIDQFRGTLLGLLPLASGAGIFLLIREPDKPIDQFLLMPLGVFGFVITLGLFIFEIYGIRRCTHLIVLGKHLEEQLHINGQFQCRPDGIEGFYLLPKRIGCFVNEPLASGVIYPAVLGGWAFLLLWGEELRQLHLGSLVGLIVFFAGCLVMFVFNKWLRKDAVALESKLIEKSHAVKIAAQGDGLIPKDTGDAC